MNGTQGGKHAWSEGNKVLGPRQMLREGILGGLGQGSLSQRVAGVRLPSSKGNSFSMDRHNWSNKMGGMRCYLSNPKHSAWSPVTFATREALISAYIKDTLAGYPPSSREADC